MHSQLLCAERAKERVWDLFAGGKANNRKLTQDFTTPRYQFKVLLSNCHRLAGMPVSNYGPKILPHPPPPPFGGLGWTYEGRLKVVPIDRNVETTFLLDFYTPYRPIVHRLATIHNAANRQTTGRQNDRNGPHMLLAALKLVTNWSVRGKLLQRVQCLS